MSMGVTDREAWDRLVELCRKDFAGVSMSVRRQRAVLAADDLIRRYERELQRIAANPDFAKQAAEAALNLS